MKKRKKVIGHEKQISLFQNIVYEKLDKEFKNYIEK